MSRLKRTLFVLFWSFILNVFALDPVEENAIITLNNDLNLGWVIDNTTICNLSNGKSFAYCDSGQNYIEYLELMPTQPSLLNGSLLTGFSHLQSLRLGPNFIIEDMNWWSNMTSTDYDFRCESTYFYFPAIIPSDLRSCALYNINTVVPEIFFFANKNITLKNHTANYNYPKTWKLGLTSNLTSMTIDSLTYFLPNLSGFTQLEYLEITIPDVFTFNGFVPIAFSIRELVFNGYPTNSPTAPKNLPTTLNYLGLINENLSFTLTLGDGTFYQSVTPDFYGYNNSTFIIKSTSFVNSAGFPGFLMNKIANNTLVFQDLEFYDFDRFCFECFEHLIFSNIRADTAFSSDRSFFPAGTMILQGETVKEPLPNSLCNLESFTLIDTSITMLPTCFLCSLKIFPQFNDSSYLNPKLILPDDPECSYFIVNNSNIVQNISTAGGMVSITGNNIGWHVHDLEGNFVTKMSIPNALAQIYAPPGTGLGFTAEYLFHYETTGTKFRGTIAFKYASPVVYMNNLNLTTIDYLDIVGGMFGTNSSNVQVKVSDVLFNGSEFLFLNHTRIRVNQNPIPFYDNSLFSIEVNVSGQSFYGLFDTLLDTPFISNVTSDLSKLNTQSDYITIQGSEFTFDTSIVQANLAGVSCSVSSAQQKEIIVHCPQGNYSGVSRIQLSIGHYQVSAQLDPSIFVPFAKLKISQATSSSLSGIQVIGIGLGCLGLIILGSSITAFLLYRRKQRFLSKEVPHQY